MAQSASEVPFISVIVSSNPAHDTYVKSGSQQSAEIRVFSLVRYFGFLLH